MTLSFFLNETFYNVSLKICVTSTITESNQLGVGECQIFTIEGQGK